MAELRSQLTAVAKSDRGDVLEFEFAGTHDSTHGSRMCNYIEERLTTAQVSAVIINLLGYEYEFGNDVFALFLVGHRGGRDWLPICILARGKTRAAFESLLRAAQLGDLADTMTFASSRAEALGRFGATSSNESA